MILKMIINNNTSLPIESKVDQLYACIHKMIGEIVFEIDTFTCDALENETLNFTTKGIYHLYGFLETNKEQLPWSIILKVIKPDSEEKDDIKHHNYWRREALLFESKLLDNLSGYIKAPNTYLVEEQNDGTIWLWMEQVNGLFAHSQEQFNFIAHRLGMFNAEYLTAKAIPDEIWVCKSWLKSWTTSSRKYAANPESYINQLQDEEIKYIWKWFKELTEEINEKLASLSNLPRVLAHQDLGQKNMILTPNDQLVLIDWQFMSISGIGEDLGKMFGANMSLGIIPTDQYEAYRDSLFYSYIKGMRDMGWEGDERLARYGYCISTALRSVWEVPHLCSLAAQLESDPANPKLQERVYQLKQIINIHIAMDYEAESLRGHNYSL
ncbi:phosphotransferase [Paenibacillus sp. N3/727]|uniref:phosphotransferase family protein n=1 Tax=Paenibacillus sp. N3/727 TaxID=2925845 RepID=UPI001F53B02A|nr:phosphotransferase [Paenibacillus sp. N3/727]UNK20278.1 phosphotransferase [Paenibacillus sp. N3/727]